MTQKAVRTWYLIHKWTSLVCTLFLLMLCITGLPLIFHDEIDGLTGEAASLAGPASSSDAPGLLPLDDMLRRALTERPNEVPLYMAFDNGSPLLTVTTGPAPDSPETAMTLMLFDRTNGLMVSPPGDGGVM